MSMGLDCGESESYHLGHGRALVLAAYTTLPTGLPVFLGISRATDCGAEGGGGAAP